MSALGARLLRTSVAVAGAAAVTVAAVPSASAAPLAGQRIVTHNKAKGAAGWLTQQLVGGTHLMFAGTTIPDYGGSIDVEFALAGAHSGRSTMNRITTYLARHLNGYVDYSGKNFGPFYGSVAKAAVAAIVAGRNPNRFGGHHLLSELKADECSVGSTTCTPGDNTNVFSSVSTSFIVIAEARGAKLDGSKYAPSAALVSHFLSLQCANGGFTVKTAGGAGCAADIDATGYAMQALRALGGHAAQLRKAASYLFSTRNHDGSWTAQGGHDIDSTALAAAGLHAAGRRVPKSITWLRRQQVRTGPTLGKNASRGALKYQGKYDPATSVKATADGIFGITRADLATIRGVHAWRRQTVLALAAPHAAHRTVTSGHVQRVRGTGFTAHERVVVTVHGKRLGSARADVHGTVHERFTVPTSLRAGKRVVVLTGNRSKLSSHTSFRIRG